MTMTFFSETGQQRAAEYQAALAVAITCARSWDATHPFDESQVANPTQSTPNGKVELSEAISRLSQHVDVTGLNPLQAKRIAHRRAQKAVARHLATSALGLENQRQANA